MQRSAMDKLIAWKQSKRRKPLILQGARQVGKTWLAREFGATQFEQCAYVSFQDNVGMKAVFDGSLNPERLLDAVAIETGILIEPKSTLLIFDEVQDCPRALTSLKMFQEQRPDIAIIAAGSLLGAALHQGVSFPVGKVDHLTLHPLSFDEFLTATDSEALSALLTRQDFSLIDAFAEKFTDALKRYYYVGGMPEAVLAYAENRDLAEVRYIHNRLLYDYDHDFSKYAKGELSERIRQTWQSIPSQLARENRKFVYSAIRPGARARNFEEAIRWLVDAGLLTSVSRITKPGLPLAAYQDLGAFKLYMLDVGLLGAMSRLDSSTVLEGSRLFEEFKGALTEQYVCQQLIASDVIVPYYWSAENSRSEVDFIYNYAGVVVPLEVKAETNLRSKSLKCFIEKYPIEHALRLSLAAYRKQDWVTNVPLYAANILPALRFGSSSKNAFAAEESMP